MGKKKRLDHATDTVKLNAESAEFTRFTKDAALPVCEQDITEHAEQISPAVKTDHNGTSVPGRADDPETVIPLEYPPDEKENEDDGNGKDDDGKDGGGDGDGDGDGDENRPEHEKSVFESSLDEMTIEDIKNPVKRPVVKKSRAQLTGDIIQYSILAACSVAFIVCLVLLIQNFSSKKQGNELYNDLAQQFTPFTLGDASENSTNTLEKPSDSDTIMTLHDKLAAVLSGTYVEDSGEDYSSQLASMRASLSSISRINSDLYGWIYCENTRINYPIMQADDNDYYLRRAYTKEYLPVGTIFADFNCAAVPTDNYNTVFYGHNVVTGSMFHDVVKFLDKSFFDSSLIYIYTMDGAYVYKPFSVYSTQADYQYFTTKFSSAEDFLSFAAEMKSNSSVASDISVGAGDTIITLSTCTNSGNGRYSLHAKLVQVIK